MTKRIEFEPLDQEEEKILKNIETGKYVKSTYKESEKEKNMLIEAAQKPRAKPISIRLDPSDLEQAKEAAKRDGIPYQTLLKSIIHKYFSGHFTEKSSKISQ